MDMTQLLSDPTYAVHLQAFTGLAGAPAIQQGVQYLKEQWGLSTKLAPAAAVVLGVLLNLVLISYTGLSLGDTVAVGAATGLLASGWHIVSK